MPDRSARASGRGFRVFFVSGFPLLALFLAPAVSGSSGPWMASAVNTSAFPLSFGIEEAILSPSGEIIAATSGNNPTGGACQNSTVVWGSAEPFSSCVGKFLASGQPVFTIELGGALINALTLDQAGNIYASGTAEEAGFATTPGVYQPNFPGFPNSFLCKFSGTDGHVIFCTFVDVYPAGPVTAGSDGNVFLVGAYIGPGLWVEKINSTASAVEYFTGPVQISGSSPDSWFAVVDANGNLYFLCNGALGELNSAGAVTAWVDPGSDVSISLALDPAGNPELLLQDGVNPGNFRLRKYAAGLSTILFDTPYYAGAGSLMLSVAVDSSGITDIIGSAVAVNLEPVNPTQPCALTAPVFDRNALLIRVDAGGNVVQSTYLDSSLDTPEPPLAAIAASSSGASALFWSEGSNAPISLTLSPADATIALSCIGNAGSFAAEGLAPNELVSVFGAGLGPESPVTAQPDTNGFYPTQLGGVEITFDGAAAPLLYASNGQVNLITPGALAGKTSTQICAVMNNVTLNCVTAVVQPAAPGLFSSGQFYSGGETVAQTPLAAAVNQDGTINSQQNPAAVGSTISLFVTGLGATTPAMPDGSITPVSPPSQDLRAGVAYSTWGTDGFPGWSLSKPAAFSYAGPAPLEVEGLGQINVQVPYAFGPILFRVTIVSSDGSQLYGNSAAVWTWSP